MGVSRLEINVRRLLAKCELMAKENSDVDWRLEKFVNSLDGMILDLQKLPDQPSKDTLAKFSRRVEFLKGLLETNKITNPSEKVVAAQLLSPAPQSSESIGKEIHQKTTSKYNREIRDQLLGNSSELRQRQTSILDSGEDMEFLLKYHHSMQEKIADEMLVLARNMKEQSKIAGSIIRKDTESVEKSSQLAEKNFSQLHTESERLQEHSRRAWKCWMWVMLIVVIVIFINMVLFMKVMRKKH